MFVNLISFNFIMNELSPGKIWKPYVSSLSPSSELNALNPLKMAAFQIFLFYGGNLTLIYSLDTASRRRSTTGSLETQPFTSENYATFSLSSSQIKLPSLIHL